MVAQAGLELVGSLLDHLMDEIGPAPVRCLKFSLHDFRGGLKKGQEIFAPNFRARPNQECKFAVMFGTRYQFRVAKIRETRACIRCRAYHHFLIASLDENVSDTLTQPAALGYREEMVLALRLGARDQGIVVNTFRPPQHRPRNVDRIVQRKLTRYFWRRIQQPGDALAESGACRMVDLIHESPHDIVKKRGLLAAKIGRSGSKQIGDTPQNLGAGRHISLRNGNFEIVDQRLARRNSGWTSVTALATSAGRRWCDAMRHFRLPGRYRRCGSQFPTADMAPGTGIPATTSRRQDATDGTDLRFQRLRRSFRCRGCARA